MLKDFLVLSEVLISEALQALNNAGEKVLIVVDKKKKLIGTVSDGDVRRAVLSGHSIEDSISTVFNKSPNFIFQTEFNIATVRKMLVKYKIEMLPVVDKNKVVIDCITWSQAFSEQGLPSKQLETIDIPVIIMAGGKGTRLEPVTTIIPKPLIPVGSRTIVEHIMEQFMNNGINEFYFTLNYLGEMIKAYLNSIDNKNQLHYIFEDDYYGTAGSLKLIDKDFSKTFIVSNCDILVNTDYSKVLDFHKSRGSSLTILSAFQRHRIPYGVIEFKEDGIVTQINEKPEKTVVINTGVYIIDSICLEYIPDKKSFHMTDLIEKLMDKGLKVCTYPVNENDYIDIGQWDEYRKAVKQFS